MVKSDIRDHAHRRGYDICAVQPPSKPGFHHRHIHFLLGEPVEGHSRGNLKKGQVQPVHIFPPFLHEIPDRLPADQFQLPAVSPAPVNDPHPLAEIQNMRGSVQPRPQPHRSADRSQHIGHGTLAVRPRHMDGDILPMRMTQQGIHGHHTVDSRLICPGTYFLKRRETREEFPYHHIVFVDCEF